MFGGSLHPGVCNLGIGQDKDVSGVLWQVEVCLAWAFLTADPESMLPTARPPDECKWYVLDETVRAGTLDLFIVFLCVCVFLCFVAIIVLAFVCFDHRSMLWAGLISLSWAFPSLHSSSRKAMRHIIPTDWCGTFALKSFLIWGISLFWLVWWFGFPSHFWVLLVPFTLWGVDYFAFSHFAPPFSPKDLSQNPDPGVKRGRCSTVDGSLPTFATSSGNLYLAREEII